MKNGIKNVLTNSYYLVNNLHTIFGKIFFFYKTVSRFGETSMRLPLEIEHETIVLAAYFALSAMFMSAFRELRCILRYWRLT